MKLKAYKTTSPRRALRVTIESDYLDRKTLAEYCTSLDCLTIATEMYISIYRQFKYPIINIDEYFMYIELLGINLSHQSEAREESFLVLIEILETKYSIEYVDAEN